MILKKYLNVFKIERNNTEIIAYHFMHDKNPRLFMTLFNLCLKSELERDSTGYWRFIDTDCDIHFLDKKIIINALHAESVK